jgi:2-keto-4-pentenoate hydratase
VGFILKDALPAKAAGDSLTEAEVWAAVGFVVPCIETCGTRYNFTEDEAATGLEKLCDASCAAGVVQGERFALPAEGITPESLQALSTSIVVDGAVVETGNGAVCPGGSPLASLTYVANHLHSRGMPGLEAGQLVIAGATCRFTALKVGQEIECDLGVLGKVRTTLAE